mmetsp:Transcript_14076/g.32799  ORF Transcript_14076/g.32799 Transcript_14076/m.32799 type:complete len:243 (-) Transcript_14076:106-834(-)
MRLHHGNDTLISLTDWDRREPKLFLDLRSGHLTVRQLFSRPIRARASASLAGVLRSCSVANYTLLFIAGLAQTRVNVVSVSLTAANTATPTASIPTVKQGNRSASASATNIAAGTVHSSIGCQTNNLLVLVGLCDLDGNGRLDGFRVDVHLSGWGRGGFGIFGQRIRSSCLSFDFTKCGFNARTGARMGSRVIARLSLCGRGRDRFLSVQNRGTRRGPSERLPTVFSAMCLLSSRCQIGRNS